MSSIRKSLVLNEQGFTYLMAMFFVVLIGITLMMIGQQWSVTLKRDREAELLFRGNRIKQAIELDPKNALAYINRGYTYWIMGENNKALGDLNKAIELDPNNAKAYGNRSRIYESLGNKKLAKQDNIKSFNLKQK